MTTKHTPKSWIVEQVETSHNGYADWPVYAVRQMPENHCLAVVGRVDRATAGYNEANANLIAAAPELLAALKAMHQGLVDGSIKFTKKRQSDNDPYHPANVLMCAAIAKAQGES